MRAVPGGPLRLPEGATATRWADALTVVDADVLVQYDHPHFGRWPAVTTRRRGEGRVTYVGTVPGHALAQALARWLAAAPVSGWRDTARSVTATTATSPDGQRVHFVHNWSWGPAARRLRRTCPTSSTAPTSPPSPPARHSTSTPGTYASSSNRRKDERSFEQLRR
ncbi:beta-galactosidase trimerization domain-containing protein [Phytohabitans sp. LJ34]|uniref:beta-galactosidase trimerization domain-containing protein n=1 Tax=Phytohabitans sp. LJ34 TaxID=3452217 RepID=UPI003F8A24BD